MLPLTVKAWFALKVAMPTLPPWTIKAPPFAVHVPMPTLPWSTTNSACGVLVPMPVLLVKLADVSTGFIDGTRLFDLSLKLTPEADASCIEAMSRIDTKIERNK